MKQLLVRSLTMPKMYLSEAHCRHIEDMFQYEPLKLKFNNRLVILTSSNKYNNEGQYYVIAKNEEGGDITSEFTFIIPDKYKPTLTNKKDDDFKDVYEWQRLAGIR